jgi:hypothetical protein
MAGTITEVETAQPKPYGHRKSIMRLLAARLKGNRLDLPQLPHRSHAKW